MNILTFILLIILYISLMFVATWFLIIIDDLFLNNTIQNTFSNIINKILNKGGKDEWKRIIKFTMFSR